MNGSNITNARLEYHANKERELYQEYLEERETGKIGSRTEFPLKEPASPEEFIEMYSFRTKNIFRLIDLIINYATGAKYNAAKTYLNEKSNLEDKLR